LSAARTITRETVVREMYDFVHDREFSLFRPPGNEAVRGLIDLHVHTGPSSQDPYALGKYASVSGMQGIVLKSPALGPTVELARVLNEALADWAHDHDYMATQILGSVVLGNDTGGLDADYVDRFVQAGARVVWLPVRDAVNHLVNARGISPEEADTLGISVLQGEELTSQAREVLEVVQAHGVAMSLGHLSREEVFAVAEACSAMQITKAFVDHPFSPVAGISVDDMMQLAELGITCNFTYWELSPYCGVSAQEMVAAIRSIGVERCTLSSDSSMEIFPSSIECIRLLRAMVAAYGFSHDESQQLLAGNQRRLLGIG